LIKPDNDGGPDKSHQYKEGGAKTNARTRLHRGAERTGELGGKSRTTNEGNPDWKRTTKKAGSKNGVEPLSQ